MFAFIINFKLEGIVIKGARKRVGSSLRFHGPLNAKMLISALDKGGGGDRLGLLENVRFPSLHLFFPVHFIKYDCPAYVCDNGIWNVVPKNFNPLYWLPASAFCMFLLLDTLYLLPTPPLCFLHVPSTLESSPKEGEAV